MRKRESAQILLIQPTQGWRSVDLSELWKYRLMLVALVWRDLKVRYKQMLLGGSWAVLQPVAATLVFTIIFGKWAKMPSDGLPYPLFVLSGLLPWTFFSNALSASSNSVVNASQLITKVYFPRVFVPASSVLAALVDFGITGAVIAVFLVYYEVPLTGAVFFFPVVLATLVLLAAGAGAMLAAFGVWYRDFRYALPFLLQIWLYATPIIYPSTIAPEKWRMWLYLNPMAGILDGFRWTLLGKTAEPLGLVLSFATSLTVFVVGIAYFRRVEKGFADSI